MTVFNQERVCSSYTCWCQYRRLKRHDIATYDLYNTSQGEESRIRLQLLKIKENIISTGFHLNEFISVICQNFQLWRIIQAGLIVLFCSSLFIFRVRRPRSFAYIFSIGFQSRKNALFLTSSTLSTIILWSLFRQERYIFIIWVSDLNKLYFHFPLITFFQRYVKTNTNE